MQCSGSGQLSQSGRHGECRIPIRPPRVESRTLRTPFRLLAIPVLCLFLTLGCGEKEAAPVRDGGDAFLLDADDSWLLRNELENHLRFADELFGESRLPESAEEILRAAFFVKLEASRFEGSVKENLLRATSDLENLAAKVRNGEMSSPEELASAFGQTQLLVSQQYAAKAEKAYENGKPVVAGRALKKAANGLERAYRWTGKKLDERTASVIKDTKEVADGIAKGVKTVVDKVNNPVAPIHKEFERYGENIVDRRPETKNQDFTGIIEVPPEEGLRK